MTEKQYGGETGRKQGGSVSPKANALVQANSKKEKLKRERQLEEDELEEEEELTDKEFIENARKAGEISKKVKAYAREIIKKDMPLLEIANKIDAKITELGAKPAFPVNLSINDIAAHYTPAYNDEEKAHGLLKVDVGIHIGGAIADTAFSIDLENNEENKNLIKAAEKALHAAQEVVKKNKSKTQLREIGKAIQKEIEALGFAPIKNLCGHGLGDYTIHHNLTIPNYDNGNPTELENGLFAIEPFSTTGRGEIYEGKPSGIYAFLKRGAVRDSLAREIMDFIEIEYKTLPFAQRWIIKKFGTRALISLRLLESSGIIKQYAQLVEKSHEKVAQAENTILITSEKIEITSE